MGDISTVEMTEYFMERLTALEKDNSIASLQERKKVSRYHIMRAHDHNDVLPPLFVVDYIKRKDYTDDKLDLTYSLYTLHTENRDQYVMKIFKEPEIPEDAEKLTISQGIKQAKKMVVQEQYIKENSGVVLTEYLPELVEEYVSMVESKSHTQEEEIIPSAYKKWISEFEQEQKIEEYDRRTAYRESKLFSLRIKWILFKMHLTFNDDKYMKLAKELEYMLVLEEPAPPPPIPLSRKVSNQERMDRVEQSLKESRRVIEEFEEIKKQIKI